MNDSYQNATSIPMDDASGVYILHTPFHIVMNDGYCASPGWSAPAEDYRIHG